MSGLAEFLIGVRMRLARVARRARLRARVDEEMQLHLTLRAEQLIEAGLAPDDAMRRARREFGNPAVVREATLDIWRFGSVETLMQDIRYAARVLARTPGFTAVAVLSLALGIGGNTAIFSLVDRLLLRMLPVENPQDLVMVSGVHSYPAYRHFADRGGDVFGGVLGFTSLTRVGVDGSEERDSFVDGRLVSGSYFGVLGVRPFMGRVLTEDDDRTPGAHPVVVVSHGFWQRHFNGDANVIGRTVRFSPGRISSGVATSGFDPVAAPERRAGGGRFEVIGVTPPGFVGESGGQHADFWVPFAMQGQLMPGRAWLERKTAMWVRVMARLAPGVTRERAQLRTTDIFRETLVDREGGGLTREREQQISRESLTLVEGDKGFGQLRGAFSRPLVALMAMVAVVLLIACANLANLLLARTSARTREIAVRLAMGASRGRVVRQLITESLLLAALGGIVAVAFAWWGSQQLFAVVTEGIPFARLDLAPDARIFAFTAAVAFLTTLLFGLAPALRATRVDLNAAMKDGARSVASGWRAGRALVAVQVGLCVILLMGTGLFTRTLYNMKAQDLGYSSENILLMAVDPLAAGHRGEAIGLACVRLLESIRAIPGVDAATFSENGLFSNTESAASVDVEGFTPAADSDREIRFDQVGPDYFRSIGIPILIGRDFTGADTERSPRVAVVNENMARFYFGDANPIGRLVHFDDVAVTIVGVAANARGHNLRDEVFRRTYVSYRQPIDGVTGAIYAIRTRVDPSAMARQLRAAVQEASPGLTVLDIKPLGTLIDTSLMGARLVALLAIFFGAVAILLASVGLYGVLAYSVTRRTGEIGVRMAIGAHPRDIVWMVVGETLMLLAGGIAAGLVAAVLLGRFVTALLFGLTPNDGATIAGVVTLVIAVGIAAAALPSRRAARIDPVRALRYE